MANLIVEAKRLNLCDCVRLSVLQMGVSTVAVVNAINGVIGEAKLAKPAELKMGAGRVTKSKYNVSGSVSLKWQLPKCVVTTFDAWHSAIEKADKVAPMTEPVPIPKMFHEWLLKFKTTGADEEPEVENEENEVPQNA